MNFARWVIGIASLLLLTLVGIGFALPGAWSVTREVTTRATPDAVWAEVGDLRRWDGWAPLGQVESTFSARTDGVGARRSWDSEDWGSGEVRIVAATPPSVLDYEVLVQDGEIQTVGAFRISTDPDGTTRVRWTEDGDFGWNPFLAFIALGMERTQGAVLEQSLEALREVAESTAVATPPADSAAADSIAPNDERPAGPESDGA